MSNEDLKIFKFKNNQAINLDLYKYLYNAEKTFNFKKEKLEYLVQAQKAIAEFMFKEFNNFIVEDQEDKKIAEEVLKTLTKYKIVI